MPEVFFSYAVVDLPSVEPLLSSLKAEDIKVWRDQERLYAGNRWPKELGEAIETSDHFLLCWSENAAASDFVELEWTTALALNKTILPVLFDDTLLPASLRAFHAVKAGDADVVPSIKNALRKPVVSPEPEESARVMKTLEGLTDVKPKEVIEAVSVHIHYHDDGGKTRVGKWSVWVGLAAGSLTIISFLLNVPQKFGLWLETADQIVYFVPGLSIRNSLYPEENVLSNEYFFELKCGDEVVTHPGAYPGVFFISHEDKSDVIEAAIHAQNDDAAVFKDLVDYLERATNIPDSLSGRVLDQWTHPRTTIECGTLQAGDTVSVLLGRRGPDEQKVTIADAGYRVKDFGENLAQGFILEGLR